MTPGEPPVLSVRDLSVDFPTDDGVVNAVRGVSLDLRAGEVLGVVGESGSGKSVTALAIMGLLPRNARTSGSVLFRGDEILGLRDAEMSAVRGKHVAMVFQDPMTSLNPVHTVGAQVVEAIRAHERDLGKKEALDRAVELLELVGIPDAARRAGDYPHEFSGGMRQRVVIAIAMASSPDVIIADEPTTALDVTVQAQVLEMLRVAQQTTGAAMLLITHDLGVVAGQADRVQVMYAGRVVETAAVDDLYYAPRMPYSVGLLASLPRVDLRRQSRLRPVVGAPPSLLDLPPGCPFRPRCPMAQDVCAEQEPPLREVGRPEQRAACHFADEITPDRAATLFSDTASDDVVPAAGTSS